jgi:hypothetical protein
LDSNNLNGTIPTCFGQLTELKQLYLFQNQISGTVPIQFAHLKGLSKFFPCHTQLILSEVVSVVLFCVYCARSRRVILINRVTYHSIRSICPCPSCFV